MILKVDTAESKKSFLEWARKMKIESSVIVGDEKSSNFWWETKRLSEKYV